MVDHEPCKEFEIVMLVRDGLGEPTGRTTNFATDSPSKLWQFYMRNQSRKPRKKKKQNITKDI